jgi:hypothetical protein
MSTQLSRAAVNIVRKSSIAFASAVIASLAFAAPVLADEHSSPSFISASPCDYVNVDGQCIEDPDQNPGSFTCCDGTHSHATHRNGACSHHGGICGGSGLPDRQAVGTRNV